MKNKFAFTFVELLLVTLITAVIFFALYAILSSGLKIFRWASEPLAQEDVHMFLERFQQELRNTFSFQSIPFLGDSQRIEFATLVKTNFFPAPVIGKVSYSYHRNAKRILKETLDISQIYSGSGESMVVLEEVEDCKFSYYFFNPEKNIYEWKEATDTYFLPFAVKLEFKLKGQDVFIRKTVSLPLSG